eukprot:1161948-Pelagomonas_calceolata.AAC.14
MHQATAGHAMDNDSRHPCFALALLLQCIRLLLDMPWTMIYGIPCIRLLLGMPWTIIHGIPVRLVLSYCARGKVCVKRLGFLGWRNKPVLGCVCLGVSHSARKQKHAVALEQWKRSHAAGMEWLNDSSPSCCSLLKRRAFCRPAWAHSAHQSACPYDPWNMACGFNARFSPKLCCALLVHFPLKG